MNRNNTNNKHDCTLENRRECSSAISLRSSSSSAVKPYFSRRHFLCASGVTLALPCFQSLACGAEASPPQRFAFVYTPNGYLQKQLLPERIIAGHQELVLTPTLQPLIHVKDHITFVTGLDRQFVPGTGVHAQAGSCWITSSAPQETLDGGFPTNVTLDQLIARRLGEDTPFPSLELSTNDFTDNKETKYFECISWYGPGHAAGTEKNPRAVFQRLFGENKNGPSKSVLDAVLENSKQFHKGLGSDDQRKLDEYLESVRATEKRIERGDAFSKRMGKLPFAKPQGIPEKRSEYLRLMADLMIYAFQNDVTRVATLIVDPERWDNPRVYDGIFDKPQNHHVLTHTKGEEAKEKLAQIDRFHLEFYAYVVERLKATSLLKSTTLVMGSGISDGDSHNYSNLEVLIAGGDWNRGHFHFEGEHPLADLWLTVGQSAGLSLDRFADSTGTIRELMS